MGTNRDYVEKPVEGRRRGKKETAYPEWSDYRSDC